MIFHATKLLGAYVLELEKLADERGYFARSWCVRDFATHGLDTNLVQCNVSFNQKRGTLRGLHFQLPPFAETKLVRCTRGAIWDVMVDLRPTSPSFLQWVGEELTPSNGKMMYIPKGFAHGFISLVDESEVFYQMSEFFAPDQARGVRWNDPLFQITWPIAAQVISAKDRLYGDAQVENFALFSEPEVAEAA
jgi:dTDP-4-dehydrorhamnose 3,5-epimerase